MNKINKTKIGMACLLFVTGIGANAQWATFNVSDALYDYFRSMRDYVQNSNLEVISNGQQLQMAQAAQNVVNADYRNRLAMTYNNILQEDDKTRPTYALCVELSKGQVGVSSVAASMNGGRGSSGGGARPKGNSPKPDQHYAPDKPTTIQENIRSTENAQAMVLNNIINTDTCDKRYGSLCAGKPGEYALADVSVFGLLSNSANSQKKDKTQNLANYSMNDAGYKAGEQYINVATLANAPKYPDPAEIQKNPAYIATYNAMITKLNAAGETLKQILDMRKAPKSISSAMSDVWTKGDNASDWDVVFPSLKKPDMPSFYEFLNFRVMTDVFGPKTTAAAAGGSDSDTLKGIQSKIAMSNLIAWQQYNAQEKTNILLSHILVQLTTPAQKESLDRDYQKFAQ
ncbi:hypothetical protein [Ralstonia pseudosolanacearum]